VVEYGGVICPNALAHSMTINAIIIAVHFI
jgi:hypothetical protein